MGYIKDGAKEEQRQRIEQQVDVVREKMNKWADKVVVGGFNKKEEIERKEGDVWEDSEGKQWTIKHGIRQTVRINQGAVMPWWCPKCGRSLNHKLHEKFYVLRGACHDCVVKYEGKMRIDGVWEIYERRQLRRNELSFLKDKIQEQEDYIRTFKEPQIHFQDGRWEKLATKEMFQGKFDEYRKDMAFMMLRMAEILKEEEADADNYRKLEEWERQNPWTTEPDSPTGDKEP